MLFHLLSETNTDATDHCLSFTIFDKFLCWVYDLEPLDFISIFNINYVLNIISILLCKRLFFNGFIQRCIELFFSENPVILCFSKSKDLVCNVLGIITDFLLFLKKYINMIDGNLPIESILEVPVL